MNMRLNGWKGIGLPDQRDAQFSYRATFPAIEIPKVKYLICPPVADQGNLGSCVFFALSYALEAMQLETYEETPINPSQLFAYYRYRVFAGGINEDTGAFIRDAIKIYAKGVCLETEWPYIIQNFAKQPPTSAYDEAENHKIASYHAIYTREDMLQNIASGYSFVIGVSVYESFESLSSERTGIINFPEIKEKLLGGHALNICGYNLHKNVFIFQNSWSKEWGKEGFGTIPIGYLINARLAGDAWTIRS